MLLFTLLALAVAALFLVKRALAAAPWPPGPPAWPLLGHLHLLGRLPHQSLCRLSKVYGPLMGLRLGSVPTIVASSPDMAKAILHTHNLAFASRPLSAAAVHIFFNGASLGYTPHGPLSKRLLQLLAFELFSSKRLKAFKHVREEEARELMRSLLQMVRERPGAPIELRASLLANTNNVNCRMAMGRRIREVCGAEMREKRDLLGLVEEVMYLMGVLTVGDFIPWMAWLDVQGYVKRMKAVGQRARVVMQAIIDERRESHKAAQQQQGLHGSDVKTNDLLDAMLLAASQDTPDDEVSITDDNIKGLLLDLFVGGAQTSSSTVEWAMADLINNPKAMQKCQKELDEVVGKERLVEEGDISSLSYLASVLKESMRLHPVAPLLLPHMATKQVQICGYNIPLKTRAYVNTWAIGRDPTIWEMPLDFWPERFENDNMGLECQNFQLLPFGYGQRRCPASALALLNVHLMLATLIQGFTWSTVSSKNTTYSPLIDMSEKFETSLVMAKPLCLYATPRLALGLY